MTESVAAVAPLRPIDYARVLAARDARFDGLFFVGITTTGVYCRPICPARVTHQDRRRFFDSAASAEQAGFRPCMRCRPELAPGRSVIHAVSRLASEAADRIAAGALNGRSVASLAAELGVSERHLRRALEREIGVSPVELAQTHRLLLAKRLLADTSLSVSRIAYASGFQSLRRFNATFRERYRLAPSALRRGTLAAKVRGSQRSEAMRHDAIRLTLAYRAPLAWTEILEILRRDALPGVEVVDADRYVRVLCVRGISGMVSVEHAVSSKVPRSRPHNLDVWLSQSLLPEIMLVLARLRRLFDLDAEPALIDAHLAQGGLEHLVRSRPGLRVPGSLGGFEAAFRALLRGTGGARSIPKYAKRVVHELGTAVDTGDPRLTRCVPTAKRVADAGAARLVRLGVPSRAAGALSAVAGAVVDGSLHLGRGSDPDTTRRLLLSIDGISETMAAHIMMRSLSWPDALPASDRRLQRAAGVSTAAELYAAAERWRPWRAYAALHLALA